MPGPVALPMRIAPLSHFLELHRRQRWRAGEIDLTDDAAAWPQLAPALRARLRGLVAGFCVAEAAVAAHLTPFAAAADEEEAVVFAAQAAEEAEHAAMFRRIAREVAGFGTVGCATPRQTARPSADGAARTATDQRQEVTGSSVESELRGACTPRLLTLFERQLPQAAADLAAGQESLGDAVGLYHLVLEGVVFAAGQQALASSLAPVAAQLPGTTNAAERVARDEKWHIGFGVRCLRVRRPDPSMLASIAEQGREALAAWGDLLEPGARAQIASVHERRMRAAGLTG